MANKVEIAAQASNDIKGIWTYFAEFSRISADKLMAEFLKKFKLLAENPNIGRRHDEFVVNLRSFPHKNTLSFILK